MNAAYHRILEALRRPASMNALSPADWDALLRHSRAAGLLSRLALDVRDQGGWDALPERVRRHMRAATFVADRQIRAVRWEVHLVHQALRHLGIPIVLLKGAAYVMADLPPARGRLFGDIDLLVPREHIDEVERVLHLHGWQGGDLDAYDQRYYREWMHEIPPVTHFTRDSTLDIHHNILPLTARLKPQAADLLAAIVPIPGYDHLYRLGDADLVLHSATHLFHEGEWNHGLRDLVDLDALLRHFAPRPRFWDTLAARAEKLDLEQPFRDSLAFCHELLETPIPAALASQPRLGLRRQLFLRGFAGAHPDLGLPGERLALFALYVRSHGLRMPPHRLIPHLLHKAFAGKQARED